MTVTKIFSCNERVEQQIQELMEYKGKKFTRLMVDLIERAHEKMIEEKKEN